MSEIREKWEDQNKIHCYEGSTGVRNLEKLCNALGYNGRNGQFVNADGIWNFLADNSGAIEAILNFIDESNVPEWKEALSEELPEDEEKD